MKYIKADDTRLQYMGRIGKGQSYTRLFVFPYSLVKFCFSGTSISVELKNNNAYWKNYLGIVIDGVQTKVEITNYNKKTVLNIASELENTWHEGIIFKRMDSCHTFELYGVWIDDSAELKMPEPLPKRKLEVYGDSVSAGEVSEAVQYVGQEDPKHEGEYSNSWYSYAAIVSRKLNAQLHDIAQGGIALLDQTGWFAGPNYIGMESVWDKLQYNPELGEITEWRFEEYTPHVVIVAIGQNDSHPEDYMANDYHSEKAENWRRRYKDWIMKIRNVYPEAVIILTTTILNHDSNWDRSIEAVTQMIGDEKIFHFMYQKNGCGTKGHIRIPEAEEMAEELANFIEKIEDNVWGNNKN